MIRRNLKGIEATVRWSMCFCVCYLTGCSSTNCHSNGLWNRIAERQSYIAWNIRSSQGSPPCTSDPRNVQLASLPISKLKKLHSSCPPANPRCLEGQWIGINRGLGTALAGKTQYIKDLHIDSPQSCAMGHGSNILVERVPLEDLNPCGWAPMIDGRTGCVKRQGRFAIMARGKTVLDYSLGENPIWDPSRFLVDELVQVEDGLLLGRADFQIGYVRFPVAYFTLARVPSSHSR